MLPGESTSTSPPTVSVESVRAIAAPVLRISPSIISQGTW
jgi:hypothetical protein